MGNEHSKSKELTKNGNVHGKHGNGSANGLSATITSNGMEIAVNGEPMIKQNSQPVSFNCASESTDLGVIEPDSKPADAPVNSEIPETITQKEEVKESLPATDPQPESTSSGEEEATTITITMEEPEYRKFERSTQTDSKTGADISTQTNEDDDNDDDTDDTTTSTEDEVEVVVVMGTAATEEDLADGFSFVIAEEAEEAVEAIEETHEKPSVNQTAGTIGKELVTENIVCENIVFSEVLSTLPKVVTDCVEMVFATFSQNTDFTAENISEPSTDEVITEDNGERTEDTAGVGLTETAEPESTADIPENQEANDVPTKDSCSCWVASTDDIITEDNGEGAGDTAGVGLIETAEPESNADTHEDQGANDVPTKDEEPVTAVMETISEVICEEPNPTPAIQDKPEEELPVPLVTTLLVKVESAHEEVTAEDDAAVEDEPGIHEEEKLNNEPSETRNSCPEDEMVIIKALSRKLKTIEELPEDTLSSPDDGDMSDDIALIERAEPKSNGDCPENQEANDVPTKDEEPVTTVMETISEVICEEPNPTPAIQDKPEEELPVPLVTTLLVKVESAHEEVTAEDDAAVEDEPGIHEEDKLNNEPSEKCGSCPEKEMIIVEAPSKKRITTEELPEDTLSSPDDGDMSDDIALIERAEPKSSADCPENQEANDVPTKDEEPVTAVMERISEVICEEPNPTPAIQDKPEEELPVPLVTTLLVKVESAHEEVTAEDDAAVEDEPGIHEEEKLDNEPSEKCDSCPEKEMIIVEAPSKTTTEELPEDTLSSPDDEVKPESIPETLETTDENAEVGENATADVEPETVEEAKPSPVFVKDDAEVMLEAAIDALSLELEYCVITAHDPQGEILLEDEVMATFVPLCGGQGASFSIPEETVEAVAEEMGEEATEALSNESEAVSENAEADTTNTVEEPADEPLMDAPEQPDEPCVSVQEEVVEEDFTPTDSTLDSQCISSTDMEALVVGLQSACTSVVEESACRLGGSTLSSQRYSISITIHVSPKEEQQ